MIKKDLCYLIKVLKCLCCRQYIFNYSIITPGVLTVKCKIRTLSEFDGELLAIYLVEVKFEHLHRS